MEHSTNRLEYKVGIFIALGLVGVMVTILLLGADKTFFTKYVHLKANFTEVTGLFPGSVVSLAGVPVGNVESIDFVSSENKLELTMKIDAKFSPRLVKGTIAEIRTQGALGDKYVYLLPGDPKSGPLEDNSVVEVNEQDLMKMLTSREDGVARVIDLIKEVHVLVASLNHNGQAGTMMKNMSEASVTLKSTLAQVNSLLSDLRGELPQNNKLKQSVASLASILEKIDQGKGTLGQLINDPAVHQSLKSFLGTSPRNTYMKNMLRESLQKQ
jgi:phospholipid/cholesterol/gamma-HCH transport system substrate-binding protein